MSLDHSKPYRSILGIAGWSGSGKTTLLERLIPALSKDGLRVSTLKHAHHDVQLDTPGKDSWRHCQAGAREVAIVTSKRWALLHEVRDEPEPRLEEVLTRLSPCDLVLVEGFKCEAIPKIEVHRDALGKSWLYTQDRLIRAVVSDIAPPADLRHFALDDIDGIATFIRIITGL
jgi:molybdopterin-guanine dinucleotide biosynthesis protein B